MDILSICESVLTVLAIMLFPLALLWQHRRGRRECKVIDEWMAPGLDWLDSHLFRAWDAIVAWCMGW